MNLNHATNKETGSELSAAEWNALASDVNELGTMGGGSSNVTISNDTVTDPSAGISIATGVDQVGTAKVIELTKKKKGVNTTIVSGNNINIEPRESVDSTKGGNISFKPGDDIEFCSHHRLADNQNEVSVKVIDGDDNPVKLQVNAASMTLTTKDKTGNDANVFDININSGKNTKGYLKVRAQAIDLRCEDHGGIAIQPKGEDGDGHMNKIKFEHGGGDGLEFGTFNTEKSSLYTDEYRFKKDGVVKLATRTTEVSDKYDDSDETTHYKYVKAADDFYDNINTNDPTCTWEDIVNAGKNTKNLGFLEVSQNRIDVQDTIRPGIWYKNYSESGKTYSIRQDENEERIKLSTTEFNQTYASQIQNGTIIVFDFSQFDIEQEFQGEISILSAEDKLGICGVDLTPRYNAYTTMHNAKDTQVVAFNSANDVTLLYTVIKSFNNFTLSHSDCRETISLSDIIDISKSLKESEVCNWKDVQRFINIVNPRISGYSDINFTLDLEDIYKIDDVYINGSRYYGDYSIERYNEIDADYYTSFGVHIPLYDVSYCSGIGTGFFTHTQIEDGLEEWDEEYDDIVSQNGQQNYLDYAALGAQLITLNDNAIFALKFKNKILIGEKFKADMIFTLNEGNTPTESVKLSDISKLVNYMKTNNQGPWASNL